MRKTLMRKITATFLAMVMVVITLPFSVSADASGDGWSFDSTTGTLTISDMANYDYYSKSPWYSYKDSITTIVINSGVTIIGDYAFYVCRNLASITIPSSVTSMDDYAFASCTSLESVSFEKNSKLTSIGWCAFTYCTSLYKNFL